jgi:predicted regulator of Ras-like GTPase activity (Roadblock/LC7/MglB family)
MLPEPTTDPAPGSLSWILSAFAHRTVGVAHALAVSADGLALAWSEALAKDRADQLAAITAGLASLTHGAAACLDAAPVAHTVVEMRAGTLLVMAAGDYALLAVLAAASADIGHIGYETALLARRVGAALAPSPRGRPGATES